MYTLGVPHIGSPISGFERGKTSYQWSLAQIEVFIFRVLMPPTVLWESSNLFHQRVQLKKKKKNLRGDQHPSFMQPFNPERRRLFHSFPCSMFAYLNDHNLCTRDLRKHCSSSLWLVCLMLEYKACASLWCSNRDIAPSIVPLKAQTVRNNCW